MENVSEFSSILNVETLGDVAKRIHLDAGDTERAALAKRFELVSVELLTGDLIAERIKGGDLIRVRGRMAAEITQSCVVTGASVAAVIEENIDERFGPPRETLDEVEVRLDEADPPEPIAEGGIDLGEIISQCLGVAIDPYPRGPGAEIPQQYQSEEVKISEIRRNPFGVLTRLKRDGE